MYGRQKKRIQGFGKETRGKENIWKNRCRWVDTINIDLRIGLGGMKWISLAQDRDRWRQLVNVVMKIQFP